LIRKHSSAYPTINSLEHLLYVESIINTSFYPKSKTQKIFYINCVNYKGYPIHYKDTLILVEKHGIIFMKKYKF